ncbi:MAG: hypothetical protein ACRECE_02910, partial [Xanthobacteraceae bacterium]
MGFGITRLGGLGPQGPPEGGHGDRGGVPLTGDEVGEIGTDVLAGLVAAVALAVAPFYCRAAAGSEVSQPAKRSARLCLRWHAVRRRPNKEHTRPDVRRVIGGPLLSMHNVEGCAGWPAQSLKHGERTGWNISHTLAWMYTR